MQSNKIDYHIHTTCSDGQMDPVDVVRQAKELGYDAIAITDHDNMNGIREALTAGKAVNLTVIPGIEIAAETEEGIGLHILGYRIDPDSEKLQAFLEDLIRSREVRNEKLLKALNDMGYEIGLEDVEMGANSFIGKKIIARAMVRKGLIGTEEEAFGPEIFGSPQSRAIKKAKPKASEAIRAIADAGGTPVLAHPIQTRNIGRPGSEEFFENIEMIIARLKDQGLKGLECYHPDQDEEQSLRFVELAGKYHLHITRGSDFHGDDFSRADPTAEYR